MKKISILQYRPPWRLQHVLSFPELNGSIQSDVVVVGGGISGVLTGYCIARATKLRVSVLEAGVIAGEATGRNAGLILNGFEIGFTELTNRFGVDLTVQAIRAGASGMKFLKALAVWLGEPDFIPDIPYWLYYGDPEAFGAEHCFPPKDINEYQSKCGPMSIQSRPCGPQRISPSKLPPWLFALNRQATHAMRFGDCYLCDSHSLTLRLALRAANAYGGRLEFFERTMVKGVLKKRSGFICYCGRYTVKARLIVFCTNGYQIDQNISRLAGTVIQREEHLSAFTEWLNLKPSSWGWFPSSRKTDFVYVTIRPWRGTTLHTIGGIVKPYKAPAEVGMAIGWSRGADRRFSWRGVQGYTPSGLRLVTEDPSSDGCYLNIGCNGIGMALAAYGAWRIARMMRGDRLRANLFGGPKGSFEWIRSCDSLRPRGSLTIDS